MQALKTSQNLTIVTQQQNTTLQCQQSLIACQTREPRLKPLFKRFGDIWGHTWTSTLSSHENLLGRFIEWEEIIKDLTNEQIDKAIKSCKFTCEFISMKKFREAALGITSPERAYHLRLHDTLAAQAWNGIDAYFRRTAPENEVKKAFIANYENICSKLMGG